jgi:hypothetical protein
MVDTPAAKIGNAKLGLAKLNGLAVGTSLSPAAVSGRPCVWWDVWVGVWYEASESPGHWQPVASRYGGEAGLLEIEDGTGRVPVWLHGATLILDSKSWESDKDTLPAAGIALLDELGFAWSDPRRTLVIETCVEQGAPMYVVGTLDERRNLPEPGQLRGLDRLAEAVRSGTWRRELVSALPQPTRMVAVIVIGYLDMVLKVGTGKQRTGRPEDAVPPSLVPKARVVWQGIGGRPLIVSNQPDTTTLESWRKRSLRLCTIGAVVLCLTVYQLVEFVVG